MSHSYDEEVMRRIQALRESGRIKRFSAGNRERFSANYRFFEKHRDLMVEFVENGVSFNGMVILLKEIDSKLFDKLTASTVRAWISTQADLQKQIDDQIKSGLRKARRKPAARRATSGRKVVQQTAQQVAQKEPAPEPLEADQAPVPQHDVLDGLRVLHVPEEPGLVMAMDDYASPIPERPALIVAGQMLYAQPTETFSQMDVYKNFGLTEWSKEGGLLDRAVSYWRDHVWDKKRRDQLFQGEAPDKVHAITIRAYIQDKDRLVLAAEKLRQYVFSQSDKA